MNQKFESALLYALIVIGVLAGLVAAKGRFSVESRNERCEIVIDYADALNLALGAREPLNTTLQQLRAAGVTTLALWENPLDDLRIEGAMSVKAIDPTHTSLIFSPKFPGELQRVVAALTNKTVVQFTINKSGIDSLIVDAPYNQIAGVGIGLEPHEVSTAISNGFLISPRIYNYSGVNPISIQWMVDRVKAQCRGRANVVIFNGADVVGDRGIIDATASSLRNDGLLYGSLELGKQIGDQDLSRIGSDITVRVHSIGGNEMPTMDEPTAVARFALAARERNIRSCYVRLFQNSLVGQPDVLAANTGYVKDIVQALHDGGVKIGRAHPYNPDPKPNRLVLLLIGIGVGSGLVLLLKQFVRLAGASFWVMLATADAACGFLATRETTLIGRLLVALLAAISFPTIGFLIHRPNFNSPTTQKTWKAIELALRKYVLITLSTMAGIVLIVGALADRLMMIKVFEFLGIRVAIIAPMLLVLMHHGLGLDELPEQASWSERKAKITDRWQSLISSPMLIGQAIFTIIGLAVIGLVVLRSGNDPGIGVSESEKSFRATLNKILFVRPRSKEFLFGHPLFLCGLALFYTGKRRWYLLFACAGAIAQASLLDTFCHLHTPLLISFLRGSLGWLLGLIIGIVVFLILRSLSARNSLSRLSQVESVGHPATADIS